MYLPKLEQFHSYKETENGVFGLFNTPNQILDAAKKTREKGYTDFDCLTPLPVHGLDDAMGLPRSGIPWITFVMGLFGCTIGFGFQWLTHSFDWQLNVSGKAFNAWPAYIPVTFELTIFMAGLSSVLAMLILSGLPKNRKVLHPDITSHKFCLWIPSNSKGYNEQEVVNFIKGLGASDVTVVK